MSRIIETRVRCPLRPHVQARLQWYTKDQVYYCPACKREWTPEQLDAILMPKVERPDVIEGQDPHALEG